MYIAPFGFKKSSLHRAALVTIYRLSLCDQGTSQKLMTLPFLLIEVLILNTFVIISLLNLFYAKSQLSWKI